MTYFTTSLVLSPSGLGTIAALFASLYLVRFVVTVIYNLYFHPLAKFPGPASRAGLYASDYWKLYDGSHPQNVKALHDKYGDIVRIRPDALTFNSAAAWKDIYGTRPGRGQLQKDPQFYSIAGDGKVDIISCNDADHSRMRKLLSHAFSDSALRQQEDLLTPYFELLVQRLQGQIDGPAAGKVDIKNWYNFLTFDVIGDMAFGESFGALESGTYQTHPLADEASLNLNPNPSKWMANLFDGVKYARFLSIASFYQPALDVLMLLVKCIPAISESRREHTEFCREKTRHRLDTETDRRDFMSHILRHNDEKGMSRDELMNTSELLIIAGSETTATLLSGLTYLLLTTPCAYAKVQREVREAFASADEITLTSTGQLPYLHACIEELATYYSSTNFHEPETFAPERWLPDAPEEFRGDVKEAMNPFSTGPRSCIGKNLAYNEMRSVMARMLWHFDMRLCDESRNWLEQKVYFMWEKEALNIVLSHRRDL
ncbi:cytochrome P450 monooxygenase [Marssonina coronariae]|uniref:Cytochrome P450 monooxygenase n=1 Tax=Diplocarpon coronariae TaxID=2795749 RepID=A0A218Z8J3_9HELO|nr:cytochrome P450 monooxygenase [Marssonina coronariae]